MVLSHPELIRELPQSVIALVWGYEADYRFDQHAEQFAMAGLPFYVCPGTSSWNSIAGRTDNCLENLKNAAKNGLKFGSKGYLNTDWGDNGHWQVLPISYLGLAAGAAYSWSYIENETLDIQAALNRFAFCDSTNALGKIAYGLGNLYKHAGLKTDNSSYLFEIIQNPAHAWANRFSDEKAVTLFTSNLDRLNQAESTIHTASPDRPDKHLLVREFLLTISLLKHASLRGLQAYLPDKYRKADLYANLDQIIDEYKSIWLLRNRPGGLQDSLAYFETAKKEYR
jgi:hexosaminidase